MPVGDPANERIIVKLSGTLISRFYIIIGGSEFKTLPIIVIFRVLDWLVDFPQSGFRVVSFMRHDRLSMQLITHIRRCPLIMFCGSFSMYGFNLYSFRNYVFTLLFAS